MNDYVEWERAKEFSENGVAVHVMRLPLTTGARYAVEVGASYSDRGQPKFGRRVSVRVDSRGEATVVSAVSDTVSVLLKRAEAWIAEQEPPRRLPKTDGDGSRRSADKGGSKNKNDGRGRDARAAPVGLKELAKRDRKEWEKRQAAAEKEASSAEGDQAAPAETIPIVASS